MRPRPVEIAKLQPSSSDTDARWPQTSLPMWLFKESATTRTACRSQRADDPCMRKGPVQGWRRSIHLFRAESWGTSQDPTVTFRQRLCRLFHGPCPWQVCTCSLAGCQQQGLCLPKIRCADDDLRRPASQLGTWKPQEIPRTEAQPSQEGPRPSVTAQVLESKPSKRERRCEPFSSSSSISGLHTSRASTKCREAPLCPAMGTGRIRYHRPHCRPESWTASARCPRV